LPEGITRVILEPMKTAVSIPDPIFHAAESLAKRLGMSRSELFSRALEAYLEAHKHDSVREALDAIYSHESSSLDATLAHLQWASLPKEDW
jgi:metal-responsive CopG/Arc/MetJ family transcriptional regulator